MIREVFEPAGDFGAMRSAEKWCADRGLSVGEPEDGRGRGIVRGGVVLPKWTELTQNQKDTLDGRMTGDMRVGPVVVELWA